MTIFSGTKKDDRPVDEGLAQLRGSDEAAAVEFWKKRLSLTASIPDETARVGALTPQLRELTRVSDADERRRLTRARLIAFAQMPEADRQKIGAARLKAFEVDRGVLESDQKLVDELVPELDEQTRAIYPKSGAAQ